MDINFLKMKNLIKTTVVVAVIFVVSSFTMLKTVKTSSNYEAMDDFKIPENIQKIFKKSCFDCHNSKSRGKKSKMKFNIDKLTNGKYSQKKIASKMRKIVKLVSVKQSMPPKKVVKKYPKMALTDIEREALTSWAKEQNSIIKSQKSN